MVEQSDGLAAVTESTRHARWTVLSALATEYAQLIRHPIRDAALPPQPGSVLRETQTIDVGGVEGKTDLQPELPTQLADSMSTVVPKEWVDRQAAQREAARVAAKFMSSTNVVLRFDFMKSKDTRAASCAVLMANLVGLAVLVTDFTVSLRGDPTTGRFKHIAIYTGNLLISSLLLVLLLSNLFIFAWRVIRAHQLGKAWTPRQKRSAILFFTEAAVQSVNLLFYLVPNAYILTNTCLQQTSLVFWSGWVRWTCWNTLFMLFLMHAYGGRLWPSKQQQLQQEQGQQAVAESMLYMDVPWRRHWPCLVPWLIVETTLSVAWLHNVVQTGHSDDFVPFCERGGISTCNPDGLTRTSIDLLVAFALVYFGATCCILVYKLRMFHRLPYSRAQAALVFYKFQLRLRTLVMAFFTLCLVLLWLVQPRHSCASFQFSWLGLMPMQVVMSANAFVMSFMATPHNPPAHAAALQVWLQEFAWTEEDENAMLAARSLALPPQYRQQPLFCFETMMHMLYWSCLAYEHKRALPASKAKGNKRNMTTPMPDGEQAPPQTAPVQPPRTVLDLPTALSLYGLMHSELFWELQTDTRCLMGWSQDKIVVSFRGTASMKNAVADMQVWRVAHPPVRGHHWMFTRPLVHVGFLKSWLAGGLNHKVVGRIMQLVHARLAGLYAKPLKIYVTGHSLGGALATLAAFDIKQALLTAGRGDVKLLCYTFGAPRTGSHAFARDYNKMVPDTWSIINNQDVVTRGGKLFYLYKRPGKRVIVNDFGHMMVCPTLIEATLQQDIAGVLAYTGQSVDQHKLANYYHAILSIILAQFSHKGFENGMAGTVRLAQASPYIRYLLETQMGMQLANMQELASQPVRERHKSCMPEAHLPERGFYLVKSMLPSQQQRQSPSYWGRISSLMSRPLTSSHRSLSSHAGNSARCLHSPDASTLQPNEESGVMGI
ncbi:TPA: hypothetical protein ACH3X1_000447 [Trebouxia sp. C0004]